MNGSLDYFKTNKCPQCHKQALVDDYKQGNRVCTKCGTVCESWMMDMTAEWRNFSDNGNGEGGVNRARTGTAVNPYLTGENLGIKIAGNSKVATFSMRLVSNEDRRIKNGLDIIERMSLQIRMKDATK